MWNAKYLKPCLHVIINMVFTQQQPVELLLLLLLQLKLENMIITKDISTSKKAGHGKEKGDTSSDSSKDEERQKKSVLNSTEDRIENGKSFYCKHYCSVR